MVHFSPTQLPPAEMERRDPVRAEVPPALPVLVPGLAHFLVVGLTDVSSSLDPTYLSHFLFTDTALGLESVGCTPQCGARSQRDAGLCGARSQRDARLCGECSQSAPSGMHTCRECSQWDARLSVERTPSGMHTSVERAPSGMHASVERAPSGTHASVENAPSGMHTSVESAPSGMHASLEHPPSGIHASVWSALPVGCTPLCGERSQPRWGLTAFHLLRQQVWERLPGQPCVVSAQS